MIPELPKNGVLKYGDTTMQVVPIDELTRLRRFYDLHAGKMTQQEVDPIQMVDRPVSAEIEQQAPPVREAERAPSPQRQPDPDPQAALKQRLIAAIKLTDEQVEQLMTEKFDGLQTTIQKLLSHDSVKPGKRARDKGAQDDAMPGTAGLAATCPRRNAAQSNK